MTVARVAVPPNLQIAPPPEPAVFSLKLPPVTINLNCTITDCSASAQGGAIYSKATLNVTGGSFKENTAGSGGGAICKIGGTATLTTVTVQCCF